MGFKDLFKKKDDPGMPPAPSMDQQSAPPAPQGDIPDLEMPKPDVDDLDAPPMPPPELQSMTSGTNEPSQLPQQQPQQPAQGSQSAQPMDFQQDIGNTMPDLPSFDLPSQPDDINLGELPDFPDVASDAQQPVPAEPQTSQTMPDAEAQSQDEAVETSGEDMPDLPDLSEEEAAPESGTQEEHEPITEQELAEIRRRPEPRGPVYVGIDEFKTVMHHVAYMQDDAAECFTYYDQYTNLRNVMNESYDQLQDSFMQAQKKLMLMDKILFER